MTRHQARKRFGQNFLTDHQIIDQISSLFAGPPEEEYQLIEIGPGRGALTEALLKHNTPLIALELDRDLIPILIARFSHHRHFTLQQGDALQTDFTTLANGLPMRLVGNLPYNVATPLIFQLLEKLEQIVDMHFMLQWEVVARICAQPGDSHYGQLSVIVQNQCHTRALFQVPPESFSPAPKVDSGFIAITPRETPVIAKEKQKQFSQLVKTAFAHRRKTLRNNLKNLLDKDAIESAGIDPSTRAETLSLEDYARLTEQLA